MNRYDLPLFIEVKLFEEESENGPDFTLELPTSYLLMNRNRNERKDETNHSRLQESE